MNEHVKSPLKDIVNEFFYTKGYSQRFEKEKVDEVKIESKSSNSNNLIEDTSREM